MPPKWKCPLYEYKKGCEKIVIDVTTSISAGLSPHRAVRDRFMPLVKEKKKRRILDFGAGALRHTIPMLRFADVQVCAVEFEEAFEKGVAKAACAKARANPSFSELIWPVGFKKDRRKFDAAILSFVLQVMPEKSERELVVKLIAKKLVDGGLLLYMSRTRQVTKAMGKRRLRDGYYMLPDRARHSFYTEFTHEQTNELMAKYKLIREESWSEGGSEQVFLYRKKTGQWG